MSTARLSVKGQTGEIRGVNVRWVSVIVAGHTVEQVLAFDVAEAEAVYGRPFDDEMDERHLCPSANRAFGDSPHRTLVPSHSSY